MLITLPLAWFAHTLACWPREAKKCKLQPLHTSGALSTFSVRAKRKFTGRLPLHLNWWKRDFWLSKQPTFSAVADLYRNVRDLNKSCVFSLLSAESAAPWPARCRVKSWHSLHWWPSCWLNEIWLLNAFIWFINRTAVMTLCFIIERWEPGPGWRPVAVPARNLRQDSNGLNWDGSGLWACSPASWSGIYKGCDHLCIAVNDITGAMALWWLIMCLVLPCFDYHFAPY